MTRIGMDPNRRTILRSGVAMGVLGTLPFKPASANASVYSGPNVIIVRYGGGVRRREVINPAHTYSPFLAKVLAPQGTLFRNVFIDDGGQSITSHAQGTLYLLTGRYDDYKDVEDRFLRERFEPKAPTLFEYLRKAYGVPSHQALIINGEDRGDEDFLTFSTNNHFGVAYRSHVLSLHRFKTHLLRHKLADFNGTDKERQNLKQTLTQMEARDYRGVESAANPLIDQFWERWRAHYGDSGLKNPRGDRLLTALSLRAMKELRPRLMMINYQDPDYVHWGNASHYTRAISIIDEGIRELFEFTERNEHYRGNTVIAVVPDCGRDDNPFMQVPYQHHFNTKSSREIFAFFTGPGIAKNRIVGRSVEQIGVTKTIAELMGIEAGLAEGALYEEALL